MLISYPNWSVRFKMDFGHHPIAPIDLTLTCSEPDLEPVLRTLRRSGAKDIHMTEDEPLPQIPTPPKRTIPLQQFDGPMTGTGRPLPAEPETTC